MKNLKKFITVAMSAVTLLTAGATMNTQTANAEETPVLTVAGQNVTLDQNNIYLSYAVDAPENADVKLLVWEEVPEKYEVGSQVKTLTSNGTVEKDEKTYLTFDYTNLDVTQMTKVLYVCAYAEVNGAAVYSAPKKYSVLEYAYNMMGKAEKTAEAGYQGILTAMLNYGWQAEMFFNEKTDVADYNAYTYVRVANATFADGYDYGFFPAGAEVEIVANDGYKFDAKEAAFTDRSEDGKTVNYVVPSSNKGKVFENALVDESTPDVELVEGTVATFNCGADGSAVHADGNSKTTYTETANDYTLNITDGTNFYTGARDAKGNGCIKLGASSKAAFFKFVVPDDVVKVVIYVAKYKANTTKINVNDTSYTISTASDNGQYTAIEVDTTTNKTVSLKTLSGGYRAMINTIEFKALVPAN